MNGIIKKGGVTMLEKRIPYGISNFEILRTKNYLYVDKTKYIEILEKYSPYQFFIRPRRFGKSLFLSVLECYYDINRKKDFNDLFKGLYIGNNPTEERNQYLIWRISFAGVDTSSGEKKLKESFNNKVRLSVEKFIENYNQFLGNITIEDSINSAEIAVEYISLLAKKAKKQVFVLIDEYDNFANELITGGNNLVYESLLHGEGLVKAFYKSIKDATADNFVRLFMTGVSPIMLDDLTSGFNITRNLTLDEKINSVLGFTESEVKYLIDEVLLDLSLKKEDLLRDMKNYYNGYRFSESGDTVFNPDMTMYFLEELKNYNRYPKHMIDNNVKTDYARVNQLALSFKDDNTLEKILTEGEICTALVDRFNLRTMYSNRENFISLLYYLGMLTIKEPFEDEVILSIPNYVIKNIYWSQFFDILRKDLDIDYRELKNAIRHIRMKGEIHTFIDVVKSIINDLSNRDLMQLNEKNIKMILLTLFGVDGTYMICSEEENNKGYADIVLRKKIQFEAYTNYEWVIELKYIKESDKNKLHEVKEQGLKQLQSYIESEKIRGSIKKDGLKKALIIVVGKKDVFVY
jgi:hypothetical protein